jgi:uncharacterized integral membrane protein
VWQSVLLILIFVALILFGLQNMHQTRVNFPLVGTFEIRTVFLLIVCFFLGYMSASFMWIAKQLKGHEKKHK